jgi:hypothetical protein
MLHKFAIAKYLFFCHEIFILYIILFGKSNFSCFCTYFRGGVGFHLNPPSKYGFELIVTNFNTRAKIDEVYL